MERVLSAVSHKEGDRVPLMLLLSNYGAKERNVSIEEYFSNVDLVAETQIMMQKKYQNDCFYTFFYASVEIEAFGGKTIFFEDGPPNASDPIIKKYDDIKKLEIPKIEECSSLRNVLSVTDILKNEAKGEIPIVGVVMSPFSLPVMQMGFEKYIELIYFQPELFQILMKKNIEFCVEWANAQLRAGANAICYFDPLASPTIIERETYLKKGHLIATDIISKIKGPVATHLASGIVLPVLENIIQTKSLIVGISNKEKFPMIKDEAKDKITLLGNLNGIDMLNWTSEYAEYEVKEIIRKAGRGGGFIVSDCHGEIPYQVKPEILMSISNSVRKWGKYPLEWCDESDK